MKKQIPQSMRKRYFANTGKYLRDDLKDTDKWKNPDLDLEEWERKKIRHREPNRELTGII